MLQTIQLLINSQATTLNYYLQLKDAEKDIYIYDILRLINNLIQEPKEIQKRIRIRHEFISLKLLDLFQSLS